MRRAAAVVGVGALPLVPIACGGGQSTLEPRSDAAREIAGLWWLMMIGSWVLFAAVVMLIVVAVLRRRRGGGRPEPEGHAPTDPRSKQLILFGGVILPVLVLSALFAAGLRSLPATSAPGRGETDLTVRVTAKQWFWEVRYPGTDAVTANELHIPVRTPVRLEVETGDVIHSLWVPQLNRKIDAVPGKTNAILMEADRPGVYRGQCAEFCGLQHANMGLRVYADPPEEFRAWLDDQAAPARGGGAGESVFLEQGCADCHTIRGVAEEGDVGPDLTHVGGRDTLAALTIPNTRAQLAGWIRDPQHVKPGTKMPGLDLTGDQLQTLVDYLAELE